jgi:hypothetical protein
MTMPSKPILISVIAATPSAAQLSTSLSVSLREALTRSGWSAPTPAQNSFTPPPVPVDSTMGVSNLPPLPNLFGHRRGERKDDAGADDMDLIPRRCLVRKQ